jgi:argininosuccinate lyase
MTAPQREPQRPMIDLLADVSRELLGAPLQYSERELALILSARHFVEIRRTLGGPAPEETLRATKASAHQLEADRAWWTNATEALEKAERLLSDRAAAL